MITLPIEIYCSIYRFVDIFGSSDILSWILTCKDFRLIFLRYHEIYKLTIYTGLDPKFKRRIRKSYLDLLYRVHVVDNPTTMKFIKGLGEPIYLDVDHYDGVSSFYEPIYLDVDHYDGVSSFYDECVRQNRLRLIRLVDKKVSIPFYSTENRKLLIKLVGEDLVIPDYNSCYSRNVIVKNNKLLSVCLKKHPVDRDIALSLLKSVNNNKNIEIILSYHNDIVNAQDFNDLITYSIISHNRVLFDYIYHSEIFTHLPNIDNILGICFDCEWYYGFFRILEKDYAFSEIVLDGIWNQTILKLSSFNKEKSVPNNSLILIVKKIIRDKHWDKNKRQMITNYSSYPLDLDILIDSGLGLITKNFISYCHAGTSGLHGNPDVPYSFQNIITPKKTYNNMFNKRGKRNSKYRLVKDNISE